MVPLGMSEDHLAALLALPVSDVTAIVRGTARVTPEIALGLARVLGTSDELWLNLQRAVDDAPGASA